MSHFPLGAIAAIIVLAVPPAGAQQSRAASPAAEPTLESARAMVAQSYRAGRNLGLLDAKLEPLRKAKDRLGRDGVDELLMWWEQGRFIQHESKRLRASPGEQPDPVFLRELEATSEYLGVDAATAQRLYGVLAPGAAAAAPVPPPDRLDRPAATARQQSAVAAAQRVAGALASPLAPAQMDEFMSAAAQIAAVPAPPPGAAPSAVPPSASVAAAQELINAPAGAGGGTLPTLASRPVPDPSAALIGLAPTVAPSPLLAEIDLDWGQRIADAALEIARRGLVPFGLCLRALKFALERGGGISRDTLAQLGLNNRYAYQFGKKAERDPQALAAIGLRQVPQAEVRALQAHLGALPPGTTLNYNKACAGFSATAGHIEGIVSSQPSAETGKGPVYQACYGLCSRRTAEYINTYADPPLRKGKKTPQTGCLRVFVPVKRDA